MKRLAFVAALAAGFLFAVPASADEKCTCSKAKTKNVVWCPKCKHGMFFGLETKSQKLTETLAGQPAPKSKTDIKCKECLKAIENDGTCSHCHLAYTGGNMYKSIPAFTLAKGTRADPASIKCADCKKAIESKKDAFCKTCNAGIVGGRIFKTHESFGKAEESMKLIKLAVATAEKCESCAVAMMTDGECSKCKVTFKDGKMKKIEKAEKSIQPEKKPEPKAPNH